MKLDLVFPCSEEISKMPNTETGKYCSACDKTLVDFTDWEKEDILKYVSSKKTCGIFRDEHLDNSKSVKIVHIKPHKNLFKKVVASFAFLSVTLFGCDNSEKGISKVDDSIQEKEERKEKIHTTVGIPIKPNIEAIDSSKETMFVTSGRVCSASEPDEKGVYEIVETMPMFIGGEDSLLKYLEANINYPEYEEEKELRGTVYARFVVNEIGEIEDVEILKSVRGSKNFDKEVIRVLKNMPRWTAGKNEGKSVKVYFTMPVQFE